MRKMMVEKKPVAGVSRQDARKKETRALIQEAARALIVKHGFEKTTMRMLAKEAGVGLGTIGLHFKDKHSLLLASFYEDLDQMVSESLSEVPVNASIRSQMLFIVEKFYNYYELHTAYLRPVVREALFAQGEWRERFDAQIMRTVVEAVALFEAGKSRGEVKQDVDSHSAAMACWSLYVSVLIDGLSGDGFSAEGQLNKFSQLLDVLLGGVLV